MRLKTLEMLGFKSFSEKTTVSLQPGVTAVVGPNGCGKSNISDAIRWVLGEQSAKHLRGDKMEDVIFNGSEHRKPLGMSEVSLTLTNVSERLPSEFGQYKEIEITRRLYRSGESEFSINKVPCRLKDIRDLMMDAGVGAKIHAIIEQDRVDKILSSKPQDRRFLFEEVAGVMKYKARRQESLSKLESTQQNQLRINDIITEVKRQVNSLDRQAKKAQRYQKLRSEMKDLDFRIAAVEYARLSEEWSTASTEFNNTENEIAELHASLGRAESAIQETKAEALSIERDIATMQNKIHETETAIGDAEHRVEMSKSQITSLIEQRDRDVRDWEYLRQELSQVTENILKLEEEARTIRVSIEQHGESLQRKSDVFEALAQTLREQEHELEAARAGVYTAMNDAAAEQTNISNLHARRSQLDEEDTRGQSESRELEERKKELSAGVSAKEIEHAERMAQRDTLREDRHRIGIRLEQTLEKKKGLEASLEEAKDRLASGSSRLRSLRDLEQSLEGYQKGVQTVMSVRREGSAAERLGNIHGLVADIIETDPRYEVAIEAVLGERLQYVVVGSHNDSRKAIDYLKAESGGRSTFVPEIPRQIPTEPFIKNGHNGVIGPALSLVRYKENYRNVAEYLLNDVVLVDTLDTALHLWDTNGFHKTLVTLSGEIVDPWGAVTGGMTEAGGSGILSNRREIKDLELEVVELKAQVSAAMEEIQSRENALDADRRADTDLAQHIHATELELVNTQKDLAALKDDLMQAEQRWEILMAERSERTVRRNKLLESIEQSDDLLRNLEQGRSNAQASIEVLQGELSFQRERLESSRAEMTELRVTATSFKEKHDALEGNLQVLLRSKSDLADRIEKREHEVTSTDTKREELETLISESENTISEYIKTIDGERRILASNQERHKEKAASLDAHEEQEKRIRNDIETVQKKMSGIDVKRTELRMKIGHLKDTIRNTYYTDLETVVQELGQFEITLDDARPRLEELRKKIDQMGPINMDALEEYNELRERYELLTSQQKDINESIDNLKQTIAKLDSETKELFTEAFHAIHDKFREVFSLLFDGGKAELVLLDESNILESGIEIIAQPRGKKFQSITLLSGGERALTAIALLFAAFLVKPSPFCLLDEVDAPLDDSNIVRFTRLLREMSNRSQFIIITHNKRTMETADALYGITMEEPGCSRVVSVKLREPALA